MKSDDLKKILTETFHPVHLEVTDESHLHRGHMAHAEREGTHFRIVLVSDHFAGKSRLDRHQSVYKAVGNLAESGYHALAMGLYTVSEWHSRSAS